MLNKNSKSRIKLEKVTSLYVDSYNRYCDGVENDLEWEACYNRGVKFIEKIISETMGNISEMKLIAVNIFHLLAYKQEWFAIPSKEIRGEDFQSKFEKVLNKLCIQYNVNNYGFGGQDIILQ